MQRVEPADLGRALARLGFACGVTGLVLAPFYASHSGARWLLLLADVAGLLLSLVAVAYSLGSRSRLIDALAGLLASVAGLGLWIWLTAGASAAPT